MATTLTTSQLLTFAPSVKYCTSFALSRTHEADNNNRLEKVKRPTIPVEHPRRRRGPHFGGRAGLHTHRLGGRVSRGQDAQASLGILLTSCQRKCQNREWVYVRSMAWLTSPANCTRASCPASAPTSPPSFSGSSYATSPKIRRRCVFTAGRVSDL